MGTKKDYTKSRNGVRVNTFGGEIVPHVEEINREYEKLRTIRNAINQFLCNKKTNDGQPAEWSRKRFLYVTFTPYCYTDSKTELIPGEFAMVVWSFDEGIIDHYSALIDPGKNIPYGEDYHIRENCQRYGLPLPGKFPRDTGGVNVLNAAQVVTWLNDYCVQYALGSEGQLWLFTTRGDTLTVNCCLKWLENQAKETKTGEPAFKGDLKVYPMETLLRQMALVKADGEDDLTQYDGIIKHEGGAAKFLYQPKHDFNHGLGCAWHKMDQNAGQLAMCAKTVSMVRVYNALYYLYHFYEKDLKPGTHLPPGFTES